MKFASLTIAVATFAAPLSADTMMLHSPHSVTGTIDRLQAAAEEAGATIFARVDHSGGAADVGMDLRPAELLIFGNPQLGTPAMQADIEAGLVLPLRVLAYEDAEGGVHLVWSPAEDLFAGLDIPGDAEYVTKINGALEKLTTAATAQ